MMIHKTICDRCKKELVEMPVRQFTIYNGHTRVDLCEDCYRFFYTWMYMTDDLTIVNKEEVEKEEPPVHADNETGYDKNADNHICDSCAFNTVTGYHYEICANCYKGGQFIPKKEESDG